MNWQLMQKIPSLFKKINTPYQIVVSNTETMEESLQIVLTRKSVYIFLSTLFVLIFLLFAAIIFFSPLRYYLPGYNADGNRKKIIQLQKSSDSLIILNKLRELYLYNLINVANGNVEAIKDTQMLSKTEIESANNAFERSIKSANNLRRFVPKSKKDSVAHPKELDSISGG